MNLNTYLNSNNNRCGSVQPLSHRKIHFLFLFIYMHWRSAAPATEANNRTELDCFRFYCPFILDRITPWPIVLQIGIVYFFYCSSSLFVVIKKKKEYFFSSNLLFISMAITFTVMLDVFISWVFILFILLPMLPAYICCKLYTGRQ